MTFHRDAPCTLAQGIEAEANEIPALNCGSQRLRGRIKALEITALYFRAKMKREILNWGMRLDFFCDASCL
jgi:hypothetical protein